MIVVDATVVAGFLFSGDQFHAQAAAVRGKDADWHCPEFVLSEVRRVGMKPHQKGDTLDATIARCNLTAATVAVDRLHSGSQTNSQPSTPGCAQSAGYCA